MFLVDLSYNTIADKIIDLENEKNKQLTAFIDTKTDLEKDTAMLGEFIENDNLETNKKLKE